MELKFEMQIIYKRPMHSEKTNEVVSMGIDQYGAYYTVREGDTFHTTKVRVSDVIAEIVEAMPKAVEA